MEYVLGHIRQLLAIEGEEGDIKTKAELL